MQSTICLALMFVGAVGLTVAGLVLMGEKKNLERSAFWALISLMVATAAAIMSYRFMPAWIHPNDAFSVAVGFGWFLFFLVWWGIAKGVTYHHRLFIWHDASVFSMKRPHGILGSSLAPNNPFDFVGDSELVAASSSI